MNKKTIIILLVGLGVFVSCVVFGIVGYLVLKGNNDDDKKENDKAEEAAAENLVEDLFGGNVDINNGGDSVTVEGDDGSWTYGTTAKWPDDMPSTVPEFTYGDISFSSVGTYEDKKSWTVSVENMKSNAITDYQSDLEDKGWEITWTSLASDGSGMITAEKDTYQVTIYADGENNGATIVVSEV